MINRRQTLQLTTGLGLTMLPTLSQADELELRALKQSLFGKRTPQAGRVELKVPALAENGNSVGLSVSIAPQRTSRPVQLVILSPGNPEPLIARFSFGPRGNAQQIDTRIRLATSQTLEAIAEFDDGSLWFAAAETVVTQAACVEGLI